MRREVSVWMRLGAIEREVQGTRARECSNFGWPGIGVGVFGAPTDCNLLKKPSRTYRANSESNAGSAGIKELTVSARNNQVSARGSNAWCAAGERG